MEEVNALAKSIDQRQPAQSAQADTDRNFSLSLKFAHEKGFIPTAGFYWF